MSATVQRWRAKAKQCRKVAYRDRVAALSALAVLDRQAKKGHDECRTYWCLRCGAWRLTSQPKG